jgi:hypothetical protein
MFNNYFSDQEIEDDHENDDEAENTRQTILK